MAVSNASIQPGVNLTATAQTVATGTGSTTTITTAIIANSTSAAVTLSVSVSRKDGGSFPVIVGRSVAASSSTIPAELASFTLSEGDTLAASGNGLAMIINGFIVS